MTTPQKLDIDDAIERLGMGRFQTKLLLAAGLCIAADTMEILILSFLTLVVTKEWNLSHQQASAVTATVFIGALIGTLVLGPLGDILGRKPMFVFFHCHYCSLWHVDRDIYLLLAFVALSIRRGLWDWRGGDTL